MWFSQMEIKQNMNILIIIKIVSISEFETKNTRENVGLFELSPFAKYELKGETVHDELQKICTANIKKDFENALIHKC